MQHFEISCRTTDLGNFLFLMDVMSSWISLGIALINFKHFSSVYRNSCISFQVSSCLFSSFCASTFPPQKKKNFFFFPLMILEPFFKWAGYQPLGFTLMSMDKMQEKSCLFLLSLYPYPNKEGFVMEHEDALMLLSFLDKSSDAVNLFWKNRCAFS